MPVGYYKDEKKSAETFREINGTRYSFPGDYAKLASDGTITLLGRGSNCINSAGEKIYPEEVEEALKKKAEHFINLASNSLSVFKLTKEKEILQSLTSFSLERNF